MARSAGIYRATYEDYQQKLGLFPAGYGENSLYSAFVHHGALNHALTILSSRPGVTPLFVQRRKISKDNLKWIIQPGHRVQALLEQPSAFRSLSDLLKTCLQWLALSGRAYLAMELGYEEFVPLHPNRVRPKPDRVKGLGGWIYTVNGKETLLDPSEVWDMSLPDPRVFEEWGGTGPAKACATMLALDIQALRHNTLYFAQGTRIGGAWETDHVLGEDEYQRLKTEIEEARAGVEHHHKDIIATGGLKYKPMGDAARDWNFNDLHDQTEQNVLGTCGVPGAVGGRFEGVTYSNAEYQEKSFMMYMSAVFLSMIAERGTLFFRRRGLLGKDERLFFDANEQRIEALDPGKRALAASRTRDFASVDENRRMWFGMDPLPNAEIGRLILTNNNLVIDPDTGLIRHVDVFKEGAEGQSGKEAEGEEAGVGGSGLGSGNGRLGRQIGLVRGEIEALLRGEEETSAVLARRQPFLGQLIHLHAGQLTETGADVFRALWNFKEWQSGRGAEGQGQSGKEAERQSGKDNTTAKAETIESNTPTTPSSGGAGRLDDPSGAVRLLNDELRIANSERGIEEVEGILRGIFDAEAVAEGWWKGVEPALKRIGTAWGVEQLALELEKYATQQAGTRGSGFGFGEKAEIKRLCLNRAEEAFEWSAYLDGVLGRFFQKIKGIGDSLREAIGEVIAEGLEAGKDGREIARELYRIDGFEALEGLDSPPKGPLDNPGSKLQRAIRIAETELTGITEASTLEAYRQSGVVERRMWNSTLRNPRDSHRSMHEQEAPLDEPFISGLGNALMHPGDPGAPAEDVVFCECYTTSKMRGE